jgi:hypothetical protein
MVDECAMNLESEGYHVTADLVADVREPDFR